MNLKSAALILAVSILAVSGGCRRSPEAKMARFLAEGKKQTLKKDYARAILEFKNAIQARPKEAEPWFQLGLAYQATGDTRMAAGCFRKATELNPKHAEAQLHLAGMMTMAGSKEVVEEGRNRALQVLAGAPDNPEALDTVAVAELRLGEPAKAEEHLQQALQKFPQHLQSSVKLAQLKLSRKDLAGAEAVLKEAVGKAASAPEPAIALGELYAVLNRQADAEQQYRRALQLDAKNPMALLDLGMLQLRSGKTADADPTFRQLASLPEKRFKPIYAQYLFQTGKQDLAIKEFERLAKDDAKDRAARTRLVTAYLTMNRSADAERVLTQALKASPKDTDAMLQRSRIYLGSARVAEAQADLTQVIKFSRESADAHYLMAKVFQAKRESAGAKLELAEALRLAPRYLPARTELATILIQGNAAQSALQTMDEAPADQKNSIGWAIQRNWALLALGQKAEARKIVDQVLAKTRMPEALVQDAVLKFDAKEYAAARAACEEALHMNPADLRSLALLVNTYGAQGQAAQGLQRAEQFAAQQPKSARIQQYLASLYLRAGKTAEARTALEHAKSADPNPTSADLTLAQIDMAEGKLDPARKTLTAVIARDGKNVAAHMMLATLEGSAGNQAVAVEQYRKVVDLDSRNGLALNNLAYLLCENGNQLDEALKYAQLAKEAAPDNQAVDDTLGWTYYRKGIYLSAVKHLESAVAKEGTARRRYHLAMAYAKLGDRTRGRQAFDAAFKMDPKLPEAETARQLLAGTGKM